MTIRKSIDALMARFGYVRAPVKVDPAVVPLKIEVDSSQVREALALIEQLPAAVKQVEAALGCANLAQSLADVAKWGSELRAAQANLAKACRAAAEANAAANSASTAADPIVAELRKMNEFFAHIKWLSDANFAPFR